MYVHLDVVHALCSHAGVHLLVAIQLVSNSPVDWKFSDFMGIFNIIQFDEVFNVHVTGKDKLHLRPWV